MKPTQWSQRTVVINQKVAIEGVCCLSKYSLLFLLPLSSRYPYDPEAAIIRCAPDLCGPPAIPLLPTQPQWIRQQ